MPAQDRAQRGPKNVEVDVRVGLEFNASPSPAAGLERDPEGDLRSAPPLARDFPSGQGIASPRHDGGPASPAALAKKDSAMMVSHPDGEAEMALSHGTPPGARGAKRTRGKAAEADAALARFAPGQGGAFVDQEEAASPGPQEGSPLAKKADADSTGEAPGGAQLQYPVVKLKCQGIRKGTYQWELKGLEAGASPGEDRSSSDPRPAPSTAAPPPPVERTASWHAVTAAATELISSFSHPFVRLTMAYTAEARNEALRLFRDLNHLSLRGGISCERVVHHEGAHTVLLQFKDHLYASAATFDLSEHCVMLRLLATHPRMTRHGFGRVVVHFLKELGRALGKVAIVAYTYPNAQPFYEAMDFRATGCMENEMAFNIQRGMADVLGGLRNLSESHPYACTRKSRNDMGSIKLRRDDAVAFVSDRSSKGPKADADIARIWDKRAPPGAEGKGASAEYLVQWAGFAVEEASWEPAGALARCAATVRRFEAARERMLAALPPTCRPPPIVMPAPEVEAGPPAGAGADKPAAGRQSRRARPSPVDEEGETARTSRKKSRRSSEGGPGTAGNDDGASPAVDREGRPIAVEALHASKGLARSPRGPGEEERRGAFDTVHASPDADRKMDDHEPAHEAVEV
mmetsp:Transcript_1200/g.3825  ORF Transcript_1200/g.3825 Transcript_1200/m.3825 type:complete len:632 (+) Transcript_1200:127-2022(+)